MSVHTEEVEVEDHYSNEELQVNNADVDGDGDQKVDDSSPVSLSTRDSSDNSSYSE